MLNYFELFNVKEEFDIDHDRLEKNYFAMQANLHPDRFLTTKEKGLSLVKVQEINGGYSILKSNIKRAEHLLQVKGCKDEFKPSPEVLNEMFEMQEELEKSDYNTEDINNTCKKYCIYLERSFANECISSAQKYIFFLKYLSSLQ